MKLVTLVRSYFENRASVCYYLISFEFIDQFLDSVLNGSVFAVIMFCLDCDSTLHIPSRAIVHPLKFVNSSFCFIANHPILKIQLQRGKKQRKNKQTMKLV